jgi:glycine betaine/proline transport system substrate-binding protein
MPAAIVLAASIASGALHAQEPLVEIAMPNWPSGQATANILKAAIERQFRLKAEIKPLGTLNAFVGMSDGNVDIQPEVWRPNLDSLVEKYAGPGGPVTVAAHGTVAWQGLCATPDAVKAGIKDIADLSDPAKTAALDTDGDGKGELWIGAATWLSSGIERARANSYGYASSLTLVEAEEEIGMAAVDAAVATGRPMVFACYAPHHVFALHKVERITEPAYDGAKWNIVAASDPLWVNKSRASVSWPPTEYHIAYASKFGKEHPDLARFLENVDFAPEEVTQMTYALDVERQDPADFADKWVESNAARVKGWAAK